MSPRAAVVLTASLTAEIHPKNRQEVWGLGCSVVLVVLANGISKNSLIFQAVWATHVSKNKTGGSGMAEM